MKKLKKILFVFPLAMAFFIPTTFEATVATRASNSFVHQFEQFSEKAGETKIEWTDQASPWSPYLTRDFAEGLAPEGQLQLLYAVRQGRCEVVLTQLKLGFFRLYPELRSVFTDDRVSGNFETEILRNYSPAFQRCVAYGQLIPVIEAAKRRAPGDPMFFGLLPIPAIYSGRRTEQAGWSIDKVNAYSTGVRRLVYLSACRNDAGAISDLYELADTLRFMSIFSEPEALYLEYLAEKAGVDAPFFATMREQVGLGSGESYQPARVSRLRARLAADADPWDLLPQFKALCEPGL